MALNIPFFGRSARVLTDSEIAHANNVAEFEDLTARMNKGVADQWDRQRYYALAEQLGVEPMPEVYETNNPWFAAR